MKAFLSAIVFFTCVSLVSGCGSSPDKGSARSAGGGSAHKLNSHRADFSDHAAIKHKLYEQYRYWKGTRYALGGMSRNGVDCSGLIHRIYREAFGVDLPRTTQYQARTGQWIKRSDLRPGDLVFFKTDRKVRHVGVFVEGDTFLHASVTKGVTLSSLNNVYWNDKYWHSRRLSP